MNREELRQVRDRLKLTQVELAKQLDVPQATISRWESGKVKIQQPVILALALRWLEREHQEGRQTAEEEQ